MASQIGEQRNSAANISRFPNSRQNRSSSWIMRQDLKEAHPTKDFRLRGSSGMFSPPSRSRGLLDKVAGFNSLSFPEQSTSPARQDERRSWTPRTIKVNPRGRIQHVETDAYENEGSKHWNGKRSDRHSQIKAKRADDRDGKWYDAGRQEISEEGGEHHRRILPRNVVQGWNSSPSHMEPVPYITVVGPAYNRFPALYNHSTGYEGLDHEPEIHSGAGIYETIPRIKQQQFNYLPNGMPFIPTMPFRSGEPFYPPSVSAYGSAAHGFRPLIDHDSHSVHHPLQGFEEGADANYDQDSDGIIYLGERNSFNRIGSPTFDVPDLPLLEDQQRTATAVQTEPSSVEKMDAVVNLMLVAAEVLDMNDVALNDGAASESSVDANNGARSMSSPSPMSLSPLQTLAKLNTERLNNDLAKNSITVPTTAQSVTHKPASIWIRGGQRSRNKDEVDKRSTKPYDRPDEKSKAKKGHKTSGNMQWCTDFPKFEKFATAKKSSSNPIRPGVALAQRPSLSDLATVKGKRANFAGPPKSESESAPSTEEDTKDAPTQTRRRRGRPAKVKFEEEAEQRAEQSEEWRSKPSRPEKHGVGESKSFVTRSGRRVKNVQYDV
jgi:hypothetical protein